MNISRLIGLTLVVLISIVTYQLGASNYKADNCEIYSNPAATSYWYECPIDNIHDEPKAAVADYLTNR